MRSNVGAILGIAVTFAWASAAVRGEAIDLRPQWDATTPLHNPHKGWYHHYFDNHVKKYLVERDEELANFPGMDHLYLRLAWSYLEPAEGKFNWKIIDDVIEKWTARGMGISFRISCKETGTDRIEQQFATPRWVKEAGAQGGFYVRGKATGPEGPWEPVYDDPVFLAKLESFLAAFAARYDGKPWVRYVDIGSVGDWGEGHTSSGSGRKYGYEALVRHVDLHLKHFRRSPLVISDDFVFSIRDEAERRRMHARLMEHGVSYRDDSILVDYYVKAHSKAFTVRSPEYFADAWPKTPTVFELEHYGIVKQKGNWVAKEGSNLRQYGEGRNGADYFRGAMEILHATYIGYHGYAREWLADNPELTGELLNRCGYWYFPQTVEVPEALAAGQAGSIAIAWQNRGVARAYHPYTLTLRLKGSEAFECEAPSGNTRWLPGAADKTWREEYPMKVPATLKPGRYELAMKLTSLEARRDVKLGLKGVLLGKDGFYTVGTVQVVAGSNRAGNR